MSTRRTKASLGSLICLMGVGVCCFRAHGQLVQPVISEYKTKASGRMLLTNNSAEPMAVVLEPRSFSISPEGHGTFRALDPGIDVQLSTTSVKLQPQETYYVFYKATAQTFPAWFTVYATFSQIRHGKELDVRIQLPHTVYLYQKQPLAQSEIQVLKAAYSEDRHEILVEMKNAGPSLGRVVTVRASGGKGDEALVSGFPMLPGLTRLVKLEWRQKSPPGILRLEFEHFSLTPPITIEPPSAASVPAPASTTSAAVAVLPLTGGQAKGLGTPQR